MLQLERSTGLTVAMSPVDLCRDDYAGCWSGGCVTERLVNNDPLLVNSNSSSFVGITVTYVRSCTATFDPWSDPKCSATSCLNDGVCQQSWNGYKCVAYFFFHFQIFLIALILKFHFPLISCYLYYYMQVLITDIFLAPELAEGSPIATYDV